MPFASSGLAPIQLGPKSWSVKRKRTYILLFGQSVKSESPETIQLLNGLLESKDEYMRFNAYRALAKMGKQAQETSGNTETESSLGGLLDVAQAAFQKCQ